MSEGISRNSADNKPLVSAVMATYNNADFIVEAIESVLTQDYRNLELIIVDDGSTDGTPDILAAYAEDPRVTMIRQENQGQTVAKNAGLARSRGKYVAFCDSDDYWLPGKIGKQVEVAETSPSIGLVYGRARWIDSKGNELTALKMKPFQGRVTAQLLIRNFVTFCTAMVRREAFDSIGGFDERLRMSIDYDAWLKISLRYDFRFVDEPVACYRIWEGQMSHNMETRIENFMKLLDRFFEEHPDAVSGLEKRQCLGYTHVTRGGYRQKTDRPWLALGDYLKAAAYWPLDKRLMKAFARLTLGRK